MKLQILASTALAMLAAVPGVGAKSINMNEKKKESAKPGAMGTPVLRGEPRKGRVLQQDNCGQCVSKCVQRGGKTGKECKDDCLACPHMNSNLQVQVEAGLHKSSGDTGMCGQPCGLVKGFDCKKDMFKGDTCTKCMPSWNGKGWTCQDPNGPTPAPTPPMCGQPCGVGILQDSYSCTLNPVCTKCWCSSPECWSSGGTGISKDLKFTCVDPNSIDESYASDEESTPMNYLRAN